MAARTYRLRQFILTISLVQMIFLNNHYSNCQQCFNQFKVDTICQKATAKLDCYSEKIKIISAFWGRSDNFTCIPQCAHLQPLSSCLPAVFSIVNCISYANTFVNATCGGLNSCTFFVDTSVIGYNPCSGIYKFMVISYLCN